MNRETRAELEAEYDDVIDPDFEVGEGQSSDHSSEKEGSTQ